VADLQLVQRAFSDNPDDLSVGLAQIHATVPDIEANKDKVLRACQAFKEHDANVVLFPEFALSGYFWDERDDCLAYMRKAQTEQHVDWIDKELKPLLDETFRAIILNNLSEGPDGRFYNRTLVIGRDNDYLDPENSYDKVFLPGIEKEYTESGRDDRLILDTDYGKFGFTTCYDYLFHDLLREYALRDKVDAIVQIASWRAAANREYAGMNIRTDHYYGDLWNFVMPANSAMNQFWTIACNAVGRHGVSGVPFWGASGIWAPSGICLIQASRFNEELLLVHNLDITGTRAAEKDDFNYAFDFEEIYHPLEDSRGFTRELD
jgi:predicted amidohydrolase